MIYIIQFISTGVIFCVTDSYIKAIQIIEKNKEFFENREYEIKREIIL